MKKTSVLLTICLLLIFATVVSAKSTNSKKMFLISFKNKINYQSLNAAGGQLKHEFRIAPVALVEISTDRVDKLQQNKDIEFIEEDGTWSATSQTVPWGINQIKADLVQATGISGKGIKVGIIDSGISPHEDLNVVGGWNFVNNTSNYMDNFGHGTHVAGIVAGLNNSIGVIGASPNVQLYSLKALDDYGNANWSTIAKALDWAITNKMHIVNLSFGGNRGSKTVEKLVNRAYSSGMLLVAATGNNGNSSPVVYPAQYANVIAVGALDKNYDIASFSSTGTKVELVAPGVDILSTYPTNAYLHLSGTSMATPHITGSAALIWSKNPKLTNVQVRNLLVQSAIDLGLGGRDNIFGFGLVDAYKATSF